MNILSHVHIHRLPHLSGVGRVIDRLLGTHVRLHPEACHRMLVSAKQYNEVYLELPDEWKMASFIAHRRSTSWQQACWVWRQEPVAEAYWRDVDLVYCPAESYVPTRAAGLVCTIHDVGGFEPDLYPESLEKQWHCFKWRRLFAQLEKHADAVVTVSEFSASRIAHFFPKLERKLKVVYNAPHALFSSVPDAELLSKVEQVCSGNRYVLVPGGLSLRKNADLILEALPILERELPGIQVVVAGSNDHTYLRQVGGGRFGNLVLAGYVPDELLNALYRKASVVWFPSRYEGFGMPVVEAMAAGAPVVSSTSASIPEVAGGAALLCDMDDPAENVEALKSILDSDGTAQGLRTQSSQQAARFSWESSARELDKIFRQLNP